MVLKTDLYTLKGFREPLYDTAYIDSGMPFNRLHYFNLPLGTCDNVTGRNRTQIETNMCQSGTLGEPCRFDLEGFEFDIVFSGPYTDIGQKEKQLFFNGVFRFVVYNRVIAEMPISEIPAGPIIRNMDITGDSTIPVTYTFIHNDVSRIKYHLPCDSPPFRIESREYFYAEVYFPEKEECSSVFLTTKVYLIGTLYKPVKG